MTVTVKPLAERDFFAWYTLFAEYAASANVPVSDEETMRVWTALQGPDVHGVLASDDSGTALGFAHFSAFSRLLQGDAGFALEDVFVAEHSRRAGVASALVEHIRSRAEAEHRATLRFVTRPDDSAARALYEKFSGSGDWAMYDLTVS